MVAELQAEEQAGYVSRMSAMKQLYPDMSDEDLAVLIQEIDNENVFAMTEEQV